MKAFPTNQLAVSDMGQVRAINPLQEGMDLRDYFAAKAMAYWLHYPIDLNDMNRVSKKAYEMADAMMKAREVK